MEEGDAISVRVGKRCRDYDQAPDTKPLSISCARPVAEGRDAEQGEVDCSRNCTCESLADVGGFNRVQQGHWF
jgi:hypothetical protein